MAQLGANPYGMSVKDIKYVNRGNKSVKKWQSPSLTRNKSLVAKGSTKNQSTSARRTMVFEEDEYIGEVVGGAATNVLSVATYPVNIGQAITFPWGSGVCNDRFEKYQFEYLEFYYKREVSEFAAGGTTGKVMLSFINDASSGAPTTKQSIEDTDPHSDGLPSENFRLRIPNHMLKRMTDGFFIRSGRVPASADIKTYDIGKLFVSTLGLSSPSITVGELHVKYKVKVFIPILENTNSAPENRNLSLFVNTNTFEYASGTSAYIEFPVQQINGAELEQLTPTTFVLPKGTYLVDGIIQFNLVDVSGTISDLHIAFEVDGIDNMEINYAVAGAATTNVRNMTLNMVPTAIISSGTTQVKMHIKDTSIMDGDGALVAANIRFLSV